MKQLKHLILAISFTMIFAFLGCGKSGIDCFTNSGEIIIEERTVEPFDSISVNDYVNIFISKDSIDKIVVEAGKNIISGITTKIENRQLIIRNENTCNWYEATTSRSMYTLQPAIYGRSGTTPRETSPV